MQSVRRLIQLMAVVVLWCQISSAQQSGTAGIFGSVTDAQNAVIAGATVTLTQVERNQTWTTKTNDSGL
jgi:hypothetical protein